jgi:hypothetical protein
LLARIQIAEVWYYIYSALWHCNRQQQHQLH